MKQQIYMVLLVDRQKAKMFTLIDGTFGKGEEIKNDLVPQKVKHGDNTWDSQDKIFRHIEDHLHRHLTHVSEKAAIFVKENHVTRIIIGSHKPLFAKIVKNLSHPLSEKVKGKFVTELKAPANEILERAKLCIAKLEEMKEK